MSRKETGQKFTHDGIRTIERIEQLKPFWLKAWLLLEQLLRLGRVCGAVWFKTVQAFGLVVSDRVAKFLCRGMSLIVLLTRCLCAVVGAVSGRTFLELHSSTAWRVAVR